MKPLGLTSVAMLVIGLGLWSCWPLAHPTAVIRWTDLRQTMDGFGGSSADFLDGLTPAQADFFFSQNGIGLSLLRTQIIPDAATCAANFASNGCSGTNGQILSGELATAKLAAARGATVFSTPWSPPAAYKTNHSFTNGGSLLSSRYADWAEKIAAYVDMMTRNGVPVYAVSVQNEPDLATSYGSCTYTARQIHDFVPYLYSALNAVGAKSTKIMIAEQSSWAIDLTAMAQADPGVARQVGIIAAHGYKGDIRPFQTANAHLWQTEDSSQSPVYDGSLSDALHWAQKIHGYLVTANVNAWVWWFLTDMPRQGEGEDNAALTDLKGNIPKRTYVLGQWSKFVRPGWSRIGVSYSGPLLISAFKDPNSGTFAIVAVNQGKTPLSQTFAFRGCFANSVTPWITSETLSLQKQASVPVNAASFHYTIPPFSVVTFSGAASAPN